MLLPPSSIFFPRRCLVASAVTLLVRVLCSLCADSSELHMHIRVHGSFTESANLLIPSKTAENSLISLERKTLHVQSTVEMLGHSTAKVGACCCQRLLRASTTINRKSVPDAFTDNDRSTHKQSFLQSDTPFTNNQIHKITCN